MWKNHNFSQSKFEHKYFAPVFFISKNIKQFFIEIIMIVLNHSVWIKCYKITFFTYFYFSMFSVAILSSRFQNNAKPAAWTFSTSMGNLVWDFHWLAPGLRINVDVPDSHALQILKSLLPPRVLGCHKRWKSLSFCKIWNNPIPPLYFIRPPYK